MKVKTIDVNFKEWFDKQNGNSYCAGTVTTNFGMKSAKNFSCAFGYGYGEHYIDIAKNRLEKEHVINTENSPLWRYCQENKIILRTNIQEDCKKKELSHY